MTSFLMLSVWDWIISISDEYEMIRRGQEHRYFTTVLYFVVRVCPILDLSFCLLFEVYPALTLGLYAMNMIILPAAAALFFLRLKAVFYHNKYVVGFFGLCWLTVLVVFAIETMQSLLPCIQSHLSLDCVSSQPIIGYPYIMAVINDSLMYIAMSWRLASISPSERWHHRLRSFVTGKGLGNISKFLLQSGQLYYFVLTTFAICTIVLIYGLPSSPMRGVIIPANAAMACLMSCRLFRELKLGLLVDPSSERRLSTFVCRSITSRSDDVIELRVLGDPESTVEASGEAR